MKRKTLFLESVDFDTHVFSFPLSFYNVKLGCAGGYQPQRMRAPLAFDQTGLSLIISPIFALLYICDDLKWGI